LIGEDAHAVAGRLLREAWLKRADKNDFNRAIRYAESRYNLWIWLGGATRRPDLGPERRQ
jgi:hypothetical protein